MGHNCFQVSHCSVNEFVLLLTGLPVFYIFLCFSLHFSLSLSLYFFSLPLFSCYPLSVFTLSLALPLFDTLLSLSLSMHILLCSRLFTSLLDYSCIPWSSVRTKMLTAVECLLGCDCSVKTVYLDSLYLFPRVHTKLRVRYFTRHGTQ